MFINMFSLVSETTLFPCASVCTAGLGTVLQSSREFWVTVFSAVESDIISLRASKHHPK